MWKCTNVAIPDSCKKINNNNDIIALKPELAILIVLILHGVTFSFEYAVIRLQFFSQNFTQSQD